MPPKAVETPELPGFTVEGVPGQLLSTVLATLAKVHGNRKYDVEKCRELLGLLHNVETVYVTMLPTDEKPEARRIHDPADPAVKAKFIAVRAEPVRVIKWPEIDGEGFVKSPVADKQFKHTAPTGGPNRQVPAELCIDLVQISAEEWVAALSAFVFEHDEKLAEQLKTDTIYPTATAAIEAKLSQAWDFFATANENSEVGRSSKKGCQHMMDWIRSESEKLSPAPVTQTDDTNVEDINPH